MDILDRFFTATGLAISKMDFPDIRNRVSDLKNKYWPNGMFCYEQGKKKQRVCLHSHDIRNRFGPFSTRVIDYDQFIVDLSALMENLPCTIFSSTIDKMSFLMRYGDRRHPYDDSTEFLIERFRFFLGKNCGVIVFESRDKAADRHLLRHATALLDKGTRFLRPDQLQTIQGLFFNPKRAKSGTYAGLELADLAAYPIYKYQRSGKEDRAFLVLEPKIYGYPNMSGRGLKLFPPPQ